MYGTHSRDRVPGSISERFRTDGNSSLAPGVCRTVLQVRVDNSKRYDYMWKVCLSAESISHHQTVINAMRTLRVMRRPTRRELRLWTSANHTASATSWVCQRWLNVPLWSRGADERDRPQVQWLPWLFLSHLSHDFACMFCIQSERYDNEAPGSSFVLG